MEGEIEGMYLYGTVTGARVKVLIHASYFPIRIFRNPKKVISGTIVVVSAQARHFSF